MLRPTLRPGFRPISTLAILAVLTPGMLASAKIRVADSVEWWCHSADEVVSGRIQSVEGPAPNRTDQGKNRDLVSLTLRVDAKGKTPARDVYFSLRTPAGSPLAQLLQRWKAEKTELVVFLRRTEQGYQHNGHSYHLWPVRDRDGHQLIVDLEKQEPLALIAHTMARPRSVSEVKNTCARVTSAAATLPKASKVRPDHQREPHLLETPWESEAGKVLYSGSACYLRVPGYLFPKARKSL